MFKKLFVYEIKESSKKILILYAIALIACINFAIFVKTGMERSHAIPVYDIISVILMIYAMFAITLGTIIDLAKRYKKTMFSDEAYLTHTLPAKTTSVFWSKYAATVVWTIVSMIVTFICLFVFLQLVNVDDSFFNSKNTYESFDMLNAAAKARMGCGIVPLIIYFCLLGIVSMASFFMNIYTSMAIGNLVNKHKKLVTAGTFIGFHLVIQYISNFIMNASGFEEAVEGGETIIRLNGTISSVGTINTPNIPLLILLLVICNVVFSGILYFINRSVITKSLNI